MLTDKLKRDKDMILGTAIHQSNMSMVLIYINGVISYYCSVVS